MFRKLMRNTVVRWLRGEKVGGGGDHASSVVRACAAECPGGVRV